MEESITESVEYRSIDEIIQSAYPTSDEKWRLKQEGIPWVPTTRRDWTPCTYPDSPPECFEIDYSLDLHAVVEDSPAAALDDEVWLKSNKMLFSNDEL